jgi:hypothetical protein
MKNKIVKKDGNEFWFLGRHLHRENGPAAIYANGDMEWWQHGKKHRLDGPASDWPSSGYKAWWVNGKRHRENGPAIEHSCGERKWYIDDKQIECETQEEFMQFMRLKAFW